MDRPTRLKRIAYRAWHRGTREADRMIGGFCDAYAADWEEVDLLWFEALLDEDDVDIMAWALGKQEPSARFSGPQLAALRSLDYIATDR